jgi:hypothetical protein
MGRGSGRQLDVLGGALPFQDLPDFLAIVCRGDLSDIADPLILGARLVPNAPTVPPFCLAETLTYNVDTRRWQY